MFSFGFFGVGAAAQSDNRKQDQTKERSIMAEAIALVFHVLFLTPYPCLQRGNAKGAVTLYIHP
jgi:hypothetical protein